jgi:hypothetical protein
MGNTFCKSYEVFFFSLSNEGMLLATAIATEFAQKCQILSKFTQRQLAQGTLKYHHKLRFYFIFQKNKKSCVLRMHQSMCSPFEFSIQQF